MARLAVVVALCGVIIASVADASPLRTCPSTCFCRHTLTVNKADCRDIPEWDLKTSDAQVVRIMPPPHPIPSSPLILSRLDMFPKVQMLSVTNRSIVELTSGNLPTLQVLDLSHNKISRFNDQTFHRMPVLRQLNLAGNPISLKKGIPLLKSSSIRTLDLGYSGLTHIPNGSLDGIPNLTSLYLQGNPLRLLENVPLVDRITIQELDLSYCKLTKVPNHSLDNLVNLQRLYLKGNDLKTILVRTLPVNLHYLDLSANRIRDVPLSSLSALKNLTNLELAKNPVKCTCELITFLDRMSEENVISEKMLVCAEPVKYAKVAWKDIDEKELCKDDVTSEESTDSSSDDSEAVSFERDDLSYETDSPPDEENRILSQHPPPLSLQKLLQKPTRYQNMEENSIQSDQPYPNTSVEGTEYMNDSPATTAETILQSSHENSDDDLIVASGAEPDDSEKHITTSTEVSSKDISNAEDTELSRGEEDDSLVVPVSPANEDEVATATESQDKHAVNDNEEINGSEETKVQLEVTHHTDSHENSNIARDRESMENDKDQGDDLVKAPDASVEVEEQTEMPRKSAESSEKPTENPDAETFMTNEETIAMGKMMPDGMNGTDKGSEQSSKTDENVENPKILASRGEGQAEVETDLEGDLSHPSSTPTSAEEPTRPTSGENSQEASTLQSLPDEVGSASEITDTERKETEETSTDLYAHHLPVVTVAEETPEKLHGSVQVSTEETTTELSPHEGYHTETEPPSDGEAFGQRNEEKVSEESETDVHAMSGVKVESEEHTVKTTLLESAENALENGEFGSTETTHHTSGEMGVGLELAQTHSDNDTEHVESNTESASSEFGTHEDLNKNAPETEESDARSEEHNHNEMTESVLAATESDLSLVHDKDASPVPSSSTSLSEGTEVPIVSVALSSTEHHEMSVEATTPTSETSSHQEESNSGSFRSFFPFSFLPSSSNDKDEMHVSEASGSSNDHVSEPSGSSSDHDSESSSSLDDHVSEPSGPSDDHVSEPSGPSDDHVSEPSGPSDDHVSKPADSFDDHVSEPAGFPSEQSYDAVENNLARMSDSEDVVAVEDGDVHIATMAYVVIAGVIVCIIIAVACVSLRSRPDKKRKCSAPVRIRGDNVSPGTEMKDMMNPLLEPIAEGQTANEFHDDPTRRPSLVSLELNGQNGGFPDMSPVPSENGVSDKARTSNGGLPQDSAFKPISVDEPNDVPVTEVVIETPSSNGSAVSPPSQNGLSSKAPVNGKPPRQNGTPANKVKVVAGVIPPAVPRTPVYLEKSVGES